MKPGRGVWHSGRHWQPTSFFLLKVMPFDDVFTQANSGHQEKGQYVSLQDE